MATFNRKQFHVGDRVQVGNCGEKGELVEINRPIGTYEIYTVRLDSGKVVDAALHELVKGLPDDEILPEECRLAVTERLKGFRLKYLSPRVTVFVGNEALPSSRQRQLPEVTDKKIEIFNSKNSTIVLDPPTVPEVLEGSESIQAQRLPPQATSQECASYSLEKRTSSDVQGPSNNCKRFAKLEEPPGEFVLKHENQQTKRKTNTHINLLKEFLQSKNETRYIENIPERELNEYLSEFILCVRKQDGKDYEPVSLRSIIGSIDRYLKEKKYGCSVVRGDAFSGTMKTFATKAKTLRQAGKGNKPKAADALTDAEINKLYSTNQLVQYNPRQLTNLLWLNNMTHFGMRGGQEHRSLCWGDITLGFDDDLELEYLEYNERVTKTRTGEDLKNLRRQKPRMYARPGSERCPVHAYKVFKHHRPAEYRAPDTPFYLAAVTHTLNPAETDSWYLRGPLGKNTLEGLLPKMAKNAGLPSLESGKRITNTSARKRLCQKMTESSIPDDQAILITGHKTATSLNNYRVLSREQQMTISHTIAATGFTPPASPAVPLPTSTTANTNRQPVCSIPQQSLSYKSSVIPNLFQGSVISGGVFNVTIKINKTSHQDLTESDEELLALDI